MNKTFYKGEACMKFLYMTFCEKEYIQNGLKSEQYLRRVHSAPIEHPIVHWIQENLKPIKKNESVLYYDFPKEKVKDFYNLLVEAHAEKSNESPRPWKFLPNPSEESYIYPMAQYEKEYGTTYYESIYKYITAIEIIINIFDFDTNQLILYIQ